MKTHSLGLGLGLEHAVLEYIPAYMSKNDLEKYFISNTNIYTSLITTKILNY